MKYLFLFLLLTACGQKTDNAKPEAAAENITNIALAKYEAREELSLEELNSLRKPVPNWDAYNRLVKTEDGYDLNRKVYIYSNETVPHLNWFFQIYYDALTENYYQGKFKPTNMEALTSLVETKKDPTREVYGRDRVVLVTNLSPSLHIYADALNDYRLYILELKSTIDDYGSILRSDGVIYSPINLPLKESKLHITWKVLTNRTFIIPITYYALTNGVAVLSPLITTYAEGKNYIMDITNSEHISFKDPADSTHTTVYSEDMKNIYYGIKYDYNGDIHDLTNKNPPMKTNYIRLDGENGDTAEYTRDSNTGSFILN